MLWNKQNVASGFFLGRRNSIQLAKTYVVLGAPRGGTSMPAGAMRLAGIFMGDDLDPANNEDRAFNFHKGNLLGLTTGISRQNYLDSIRRKAYPLDAGVATSCEAQPPGRRRTFVAGTCE
jgi:hypothetical protein